MFEEEPRITLDQKAFKALAAGTRVKILKLLNKRRHTQSEIAGELAMAVPTVKQHLDELEKAGLVSGVEEGRKWRYYELTDAGETILNPERKRIWIVLILLVFAVFGGVFGYLRQILSPLYAGKSLGVESAMKAAPAMESVAPIVQPAVDAVKPLPWALILYLSFIFVLLVLLAYFVWKSRKLRFE